MGVLYIFLFVLAVFLFIVLIYLIFVFIDFLISIFVIGIPGLIFALVVCFVMKFIYPPVLMKRFKNSRYLSRIMSVELEESRLKKRVDKSLLQKKIKSLPLLLLLAISGVILLYLYLNSDYTYISVFFEELLLSDGVERPDGGLEELLFYQHIIADVTEVAVPAMIDWRSSPGFGLSLLSSGVVAAGFFIIYNPDRILHRSVLGKISQLSGRLQEINLPVIRDIQGLENRMKEIADNWGCQLQLSYIDRIKSFIESNKEKVVLDPSFLKKKVKLEAEEAEEDLNRLLTCFDAYRRTVDLAETTQKVVNRTGSKSYVREMDRIYNGLESSQLRELITKMKWDDFEDIISSIERDLRELRRGAEQYIKSDRREDYKSKEKRTGKQDRRRQKEEDRRRQKKGDRRRKKQEEEISGGKMTEKKALSILNLPANAYNEDIKKQYRMLIRVWHPDHGGNAQRFDAIKKAYNFLRKSRNLE